VSELKHSMAQATEIQRAFQEKFGANEELLGIGIGLNAAGDDLAISVLVKRPETASQLPTEFKGLDVVVDVVGANTAY
jgi:hypothetical protein